MQSVWIKRVHIDSIQSKYDIDTRNQCTVQKPWSFYELAKTRQQPTKNHRSGWLILNVWCWTWQHCVAKEVRYKKSETVAELRRRVEEQLDLAASQARGSFGSGQGVKILGTWQLEWFFAMFRIIGVMSVHVLMPWHGNGPKERRAVWSIAMVSLFGITCVWRTKQRRDEPGWNSSQDAPLLPFPPSKTASNCLDMFWYIT